MDSLFQNLVPEHLLEIFLIIFISALLVWFFAMYFWKQKLSNATLEWESRFNTKSRDYNELRNNYSSLDKNLKASQTKVEDLESKFLESNTLSQKLSEEKHVLTDQLKRFEASNLEFQKKISNLEIVKDKHQQALPILEANQLEIEKYKREVEILGKQKQELSGVINGLKDFRTRYEDIYLQLNKQKEQLEISSTKVGELERAIEVERKEGPKVLELTGKLRWIQAEKNLLVDQLSQLELVMEEAAFAQLRADVRSLIPTEEAPSVEVVVQPDPALQTYQVKLWEKEGELRWSEEDKRTLTQKIEELEYAKQTISEPHDGEKIFEENGIQEVIQAFEPIAIDKEGKLTQLALELEVLAIEKTQTEQELEELLGVQTSLKSQLKELAKEKGSLFQITQSQLETIDELNGRIRWSKWEEDELTESNKELKEKLDIRFKQWEEEQEKAVQLAEAVKVKENEVQEIEQRLAAEQVAQALIESEEMEEMKFRIEELQASTYLAAEDQWNQLAEQSRLSLLLKHAEAKAQQYGSEVERLSQEGTENREELIQLFDQVQALQNSAYAAAQWTTDHEAENARLAHSFSKLREEIEALNQVESQNERLQEELLELRESTYLAAQVQADSEAESTRNSLHTKTLKSQLVKFQGIASEKEILLAELEDVKKIASEKELLQEELENLKWVASEKEQLQEELEGLKGIVSEKESLQQELKGLKGVVSEKDSLQLEVDGLRSTTHTAAKQLADDEASLVRQQLHLQVLEAQLQTIQLETENEKSQLREEIEALHQSMEASEKDRMEHQKRVEELEQKLMESQSKIEEFTSEKNSDSFLLQEMSGTQALLEQERTQLLEQLQNLRESTQLAAQNSADNLGELARMHLDLGKAKQEIHSLEEEIQNGAVQIQQLQAQMIQQDQKHTREVEEIQESLQLTQSQELATSETKVQELATRITELEEELKNVQTERGEKDLRITQLEARIGELSSIDREEFPAFPTTPASVSFALELTEEEKDNVRQRIFERREELELNFGRIGIAASTERDELTQIEGIDTFTEERLNLIQIYCFRQIANFSEEEIRTITEALELTPGIIPQKNWIQQAKDLRKK
ncbi:MAG: hypothetical protein AAF694_06230 [Bacteroidota bacterium]